MHLLSCKGRDSKLYHADGDYCTVPPCMCQSLLLLLCRAALPSPASPPCPSAQHNEPPRPRSLHHSKEQKLSRGSHSAAAAREIMVRASMFVTCLPNTASLTLSIWTACSVSAAHRFATDPSFSYSRESKMLAERDFPSCFFLFFHCFQESASFLLSKIQCCNFVIAVFIKWIINLKALSPNLYMHV